MPGVRDGYAEVVLSADTPVLTINFRSVLNEKRRGKKKPAYARKSGSAAFYVSKYAYVCKQNWFV